MVLPDHFRRSDVQHSDSLFQLVHIGVDISMVVMTALCRSLQGALYYPTTVMSVILPSPFNTTIISVTQKQH